jgi:hypothetical protein
LIELTFSFAISAPEADAEDEVDEDEEVEDEVELLIPFATVPVTSTLWPTWSLSLMLLSAVNL